MSDNPPTQVPAAPPRPTPAQPPDPVTAPAPPTFQVPSFSTAPADELAAPTQGKPVVLATRPTTELVIPGVPGLHVTSTGVALSEADAKQAQAAGEALGIDLIDITEVATDRAERASAIAHFQNKKG